MGLCRAWLMATRALIAAWIVALVLIGPIAARAQSLFGSGADTIAEIRVEGIQRIEPETVRSYMHIRAGEPFDPARIDASLKALYGTGLFSDVSIRREGNNLIVTVVENPIINRVAFEGNDFVDEETLRREVQLRSRLVYSRTQVQNDVRRIIEIYSRLGRFAVTVVPQVIQRDQNRVDLVFEIDEGEPTLIRKITFIGNQAFSDSRLRSVIQSAETSFYAFLTANDVYDPDRVRFDEEQLRRYYLSKGYADFSVLSTTAELSQDKKDFFLTFTVEEGPRYRLRNVDITSQIKGVDPKAVEDALEVSEDDWYDGEDVEESVNQLTNAINRLGFAFVDVRPRLTRDREARAIDVTFELQEGPRLFVERINIRGNVRTLDHVIRRELRLAEGDPFNRARYQRSQRRVKSLGYFKSAEFSRRPGSAEDKTVIDVEVEEQSTGSFVIGAGVSSAEGLLTQTSLTERNLLGKGQELRLAASLGSQTQNYELSFTEPYFLERNLSAGFDIFRVTREGTESISFDQSRTGAELRTGFSYNDRLRQGFNYRIVSKEVTDIDDDASLFVKQQEGRAVTSSIGQSLVYDVRDSRIDPTEGYILQLSNDLAGLGGDNRWIRTNLGGAIYYEVVDNWVVRLGSEMGYILGLGKDIRIDDRYFVGGDSRRRSLRGFAVGGIGPRDEATGDALGGNLFVTGSAELAVPLGTSSEYQTKGFLFSDVGTLTDVDASGSGIQDDETIRMSLGVGVGIRTPFGVIRLNYAQPIVKTDFDEKEAFSFRFGTSF